MFLFPLSPIYWIWEYHDSGLFGISVTIAMLLGLFTDVAALCVGFSKKKKILLLKDPTLVDSLEQSKQHIIIVSKVGVSFYTVVLILKDH